MFHLRYEYVLVFVDPSRAGEIATKFFGQYHSDVTIKSVTLHGSLWVVNVSVGLASKKSKQVKIDATTGAIVECLSLDYEKITNEILAIDDSMRYVIITDEKGTSLFNKIKAGKAILFKNKDQISMISSELRTLRELLKFHNDDLGPAQFVHIIREKVDIFIYFTPELTTCFSSDTGISDQKVLEISKKSREIIQKIYE